MSPVKTGYVNRRRSGIGLICVLLMTACSIIPHQGALTHLNHPARVYTDSETCRNAVKVPAPPNAQGFSQTDDLDLLSWNMYKGAGSGWRADLKKLAEGAELVLIQEALLDEDMKQPFDESSFWSFSPGFQGDGYSSGVMTISHVPPDLICSLQTVEPWLNTPKAASVLRFPIRNSRQSILLANMHLVNFTFGIESFDSQIKSVVDVLEAHSGPILLSGDFNTWKDSRLRLLTDSTKRLGLTTVEFNPDERTQWFGNYLDYVFVRGFDIKSTSSPVVTSSDHNPLQVKLVLTKED